MKRTIIGLITILLFNGIADAQLDNNDIDIVQSIFGKSKRLIVNEYIQLDGEEKNLFWKIYDQYEEKRKSVEKERFLLLKEYADNYETLDAAEASKLITAFIKSSDKYNNLYKAYFKKVKKAIGGLKATTFIQLEIFIQTSVQSDLQSQIPVIGELEKFNSKKTEQKIGILND